MASVQTWILSKSKNRRGGFVKRNSSRQGALDGSRARFSREVQGKLRNTMRKPKNGSVEGKDRLRALAAAAARAAGANLTTYFADDDQRPVNPDGLAATTPPIKLVPASVGFSQAGPSAAPVTLGSGTPSAFAAVSATVEAASPAYGKPEEAELQAKHAARAARLVTSGDGFVTHMDTSRSTSGELPPQLVGVGPPAPPGQPNLEFLPVLPPMHVHSHPVTTGQGPPHSPAPTAYVRTNRDGGQGVVPKIVLARASSAGAAGQPGGLPDLDRARSGSGGLPGSVSVAPLHPQPRNSPIPQVTISLKRDLSPAATSGELEAGGVGEGAFGSRRRGRGPGLPPLGAKVTGRRGKRGGGPSPDGQPPHQRWAALSRAASDGSSPAGQPPFLPLQPQQQGPAPGEAPPVMPKITEDQSDAQKLPEDEVMTESEVAARGDVTMEQGASGQLGEASGQPAVGIAESGRAPSFSPFSVAPPAGESTSDSDTESDESRDKQAGEGQPQPSEKRQGSAADEAGRPTKKVRGHDGQPRAARAASLGTVIAAVEERATRQGSGAMDAAVGRAPTTVEDCLQSSSFGKVRKSKRSAKPPREEGAPQRVWGSVGGPLAPSGVEGQEATLPGIGSLSLEEQNNCRIRASLPSVSGAPVAAASAAGRSGLALSSSESAAAISLLALAPQTPPSVSSPSTAPVHHDSGDLENSAGAAAAAVAGGAAGPGASAAAAIPSEAPAPQQPVPMQIAGNNSAAAEGTAQRVSEESNGGTNGAQASGGGAGQGSAGGDGAAGSNGNGMDRAGSAGLPIAPLRLDSGLQAQDPNGTGSDMAMGLWSGKLKHRMATQGGYSTVDLLNLTALIPDRYLEQLPPTLFVTELVARGAVQMSKHYIVQCRLGFLTDRQLTKLQLLANSKLVAVCQLQHCKLTLVPYIEARSGQLRIMGFLIADDLGT